MTGERFGELGMDRAELLRRGAAGAAGLAVLGAVGCGDDDDNGSTGTATAAADKPPSKPTGVLKTGVPAGVAGVIADPTVAGVGFAGAARLTLINDRLMDFYLGKVGLALAESVEPGSTASVWDITLRDGITFTDGKPLRPEDIIWTLDYYKRKASSVAFTWIGITDAKKTGPRNVRFTLARPEALFIEKYATQLYVLPEDYDPKKPIGTGPMIMESIDPGRRTVFVPNPDYWGEGPYAERLEIYEFADDAARVNALKAGQVDVIDAVPAAQIPTLDSAQGLSVLKTKSDTYTPFVMNTAAKPFDDERVRQAMRLIIDRKGLVEQVYAGFARPGNDVTDPLGPDYFAGEFPQREQDIEQAKSLLAAAGQQDLTVTLNTSPVGAGAVEQSQVLAEQAKAAGVTVKLKQIDPAQFFTPEAGYGSYPFCVSIGGSLTVGYLANVSSTLGPEAVFPETHWTDKEWQDIYAEAIVTVDEAKRGEMVKQLQQIDYERGGYIIATFLTATTGHSDKVKGLEPEAKLGMNEYKFQTMWVA